MKPSERFIAAARAMVGKARWRHRGRKPWAVDCIGLVVCAARNSGNAERMQLGPEHERMYGREPWEDSLRKGGAERFGAPIELGDAMPSDLVLIRWSNGEPAHIGILADYIHGGLSIIHAHNVHGVIEHRLAGEILDGIVAVYRPFRET